MDQITLLDVAKQQQDLTSDYKLAQALGVRPSRISDLRSGRKRADEAEIMMLADMAGIDPHIAFAAVHKDREKNASKKAYWEKITKDFVVATIAGFLIWSGFPASSHAETVAEPSINYANI